MNKKNIQIIITAALALVLIIVFINSMRTAAGKKAALKSYAVTQANVLKLQAFVAPEDKAKNKIEEGLLNVVGRDPFKRQSAAEDIMDESRGKKIEGIAGILLTGIVYDEFFPGRNLCIINGEEARVKDKIGDFAVTDIKENQVTLINDKEQKEYKLKLWEEQ